ncbi:4598_t:CDS:1, partial [Dentiscutata erythropus]
HKALNYCDAPGSPCWTNKVHWVNYQNSDPILGYTAKQCCQLCVNDPKCKEWSFREGICFNIADRNLGLKVCDQITESAIVSSDSGIIRCDDGCLPESNKSQDYD